MKLQSYIHRTEPSLVAPGDDQVEPIVARRLHWFALYTYWKTLPITIGLVTLISLLPGVLAILIITGFGLFYEYGENLPSFLENTVLQDAIDYELQGARPLLHQLGHNRYHPELTIILGLVALSWIVVRSLEWRSTTYGVTNDHIWMQGGLYWKWNRYLPMERVTSLELTANWLHRLLDLRAVEFTSNTPEKEISTIRLAAIPTREAIQIQRIVLGATKEAGSDWFRQMEAEDDEVPLANISTWQLIAAGMTSFEIRMSFVGAIAAFHLFSKSVLKTWRNELIHWFVTTVEQRHAFADLVDFTIVLLLMFWALSIVTFVATFSRFRLERLGHLALIEHGLVTKHWRAVLLPRVQAVTFVETPVQERRKTGSLRIELAGSHQRSLERKMLLPSLPRAQALQTLEHLFGGTFFENISRQLELFQRPPSTYKRMYTMFWPYRIIGLVILMVVIDYLSPDVQFEHVTIAVVLLMVIPGYLYGLRQFKDAAWLLNDDRNLIVRERYITRRTIFCPADRLQWRGMKQMHLPGQKPGGATVVAYVAASGKVDGVGKGYVNTGWPMVDGRIRVRGIPREDAVDLLDRMGPQADQGLYRPHVV